MARDDDRDRVRAERLTDRARGSWLADATRDVAVGDERAGGDAGGRLQDAALEVGETHEVERHAEPAALAAQESPELVTERGEPGVIPHRGRAVLVLHLAPEGALGTPHAEIREAVLRGGDVQPPDRRREGRVTHECARRSAPRGSRLWFSGASAGSGTERHREPPELDPTGFLLRAHRARSEGWETLSTSFTPPGVQLPEFLFFSFFRGAFRG
jgi:hypothetical protein